VGPKKPTNPKPTRVGKGGSGGRSPHGGGPWECPPTKPKVEASCHISNPAMSGAQDAGKP